MNKAEIQDAIQEKDIVILHDAKTKQCVVIRKCLGVLNAWKKEKVETLTTWYSIEYFDNFVCSEKKEHYAHLKNISFRGFSEWKDVFFSTNKEVYERMLAELNNNKRCNNIVFSDEKYNTYRFDIAITENRFSLSNVADECTKDNIENFFNNNLKHLIKI